MPFSPSILYISASDKTVHHFLPPNVRQRVANELLPEEISSSSLVIVEPDGPVRGQLLREIYSQKKSFALVGIDKETPEQLMHIANICRKRHIASCWLGSLRFYRPFAKLREFSTTPLYGEIHSMTLKYDNAHGSRTLDIACQDLVHWLAPDFTGSDIFIDNSLETGSVILDIRFSRAWVRCEIDIHHRRKAVFSLKSEDFGLSRDISYPPGCDSEFTCLLSTITHKTPWLVLADFSTLCEYLPKIL